MADPKQARAANKRSLALAEDGLAAEALTENAQTVTLYRQLIAAHPDEYDAELAEVLDNRSGQLAEVGRAGYRAHQPGAALEDLGLTDKTLTDASAALALHRELAAAKPDEFRPYEAMALTNQSGALANLGRSEDALMAVNDAIDAFRPLGATVRLRRRAGRCPPTSGGAGRGHRGRRHLLEAEL